MHRGFKRSLTVRHVQDLSLRRGNGEAVLVFLKNQLSGNWPPVCCGERWGSHGPQEPLRVGQGAVEGVAQLVHLLRGELAEEVDFGAEGAGEPPGL